MPDTTARSIIDFGFAAKFMALSPSDAKLDRLATYIDLASGEIERRTNRKVVVQEVTSILDGNGLDFLSPPYSPVKEVTSIEYRETDGTGNWAALISDASLISIPETGWAVRLLGGETFPQGTQNIKIVYKAGWTQTEVPADLQRTCLEMAAKMFYDSAEGRGTFGQLSFSQGVAGGSVSTSEVNFEERWDKVIQRYRLRGLR